VKRVVARLDIEDIVEACLDKPAVIVDDQGVQWIYRYVQVSGPADL